MYDLRLSSNHTASEQFSSIFGICLFVFSFVYPLFYCGLLIRKFKPMEPLLSEDEYMAKLKNGTLKNFKLKYHTEFTRNQYFEKYGGQLKDFRLESANFGIYEAVSVQFF